MPPKKGRRKKEKVNSSTANAAPPSSDDAKPDVNHLNANLESEPDLPSDPLTTAPTAEPVLTSVAATEVPNGLPSIPDEPTPSTQSAASPTAPATRGRGVLGPKFAGRRSQVQREKLQKEEEDRRRLEASARAAEDAKARRNSGRRDGARRGRGRGGYMGESDRPRHEAVASGPFSSGQVQKDSRPIRRGPPSSGWVGLQPGAPQRPERPAGRRAWSHTIMKGGKTADGKAVKAEAGSSSAKKPAVDRDGDLSMSLADGGYISSDEDEGEGDMQRVNVEDFGVIDLTEEDDPANFFNPVRMTRVQHIERSLGINAEGATNQEGAISVDANDVTAVSQTSSKGKGKQRATSDFEVVDERDVFQAVYSESDDEIRVSAPQIKPDPEPMVIDGAPSTDERPSSPESRRKGKERKARGASPESMPAAHDFHTREDVEEWEREQDDLRIIRAELGEVTEGGDQQDGKRAQKAYLFQFPPILPDLQPIHVKPDPDANEVENNEDVMPVDPPSNADKPIKVEEDEVKPDIQTSSLPSGAVGKLKVHASGRVSLDWGGTSLCLGMGTNASFLQDILYTILPDRKDGMDVDGASTAGKAINMGQVKGKFVVTPDWEELLK
jgi:DNA-directed RNA polymerase III subunit RPC4